MARLQRFVVAVIVSLFTLVSTAVRADEPEAAPLAVQSADTGALTEPTEPRAQAPASAPATASSQLFLNTFWVFRWYPLGVDAQGTLLYKNKLGDSDELLYKTRFWSLGATGTYNPAEWSVSAAAEIEPIAIFQLRAQYELRGYFGLYNEILSWNHRLPVYTDDVVKELGAQPGVPQATARHSLRIQPKLRAAIPGTPIAMQNVSTFDYGSIALRAGDVVYYDPSRDLLAPVNGWVFSNQTSVVFLADKLTAGVVYEFLSPQGLGPENRVHRLGVLAAYKFYENPSAWVNKPTLFFLSNWHLVSRNRAGLMPTLVIGVSTETDLFHPRG